ncbi:hypothetical protein ATHEMM101B_10190 [Atlantibacter hermannii]
MVVESSQGKMSNGKGKVSDGIAGEPLSACDVVIMFFIGINSKNDVSGNFSAGYFF